MTFNSLDYAIFLSLCFFIYWSLSRTNYRNGMLVIASYLFYGWWDHRFLILIAVSSLTDYTVGRLLESTDDSRTRKLFLSASLITNLGLLGFFKYYNFFVESAAEALTFLGLQANVHTLQIILPVGISFYTFQTLGYAIDVYHRRVNPERNLINFFAYVSFFPQLVAGPIERASNLLPQFREKRVFSEALAVEGLRQILWGLFKKVAIADACAPIVEHAFVHHTEYSFLFLATGVIFFALQIYCDFSGYSDIAIGTAKLLGFRLTRNFAYPYFASNVAEFWKRWHISLTTWFRDYVYIPLGGSRKSTARSLINITAVFLLSGLWHGAKWNFVFWGALNAAFFIPLFLLRRHRQFESDPEKQQGLPSIRQAFRIAMTFTLIGSTWVFFRAESVEHAFSYLQQMATVSMSLPPSGLLIDSIRIAPLITFLFISEWYWRNRCYPFEGIRSTKRARRWFFYLLVGALIVCSKESDESFIYFQF